MRFESLGQTHCNKQRRKHMTAQELIDIFYDTQMMIQNSPYLQAQQERSKAESRLYLEEYRSYLRRPKTNVQPYVYVEENTTFRCAHMVSTHADGHGWKKIAVLNFANPVEPGGGVFRGAMAQEECLCRCSTLYNVLAQPYFQKHYYGYHAQKYDNFYTDRILYTPGITVFKSDDPVPQVLNRPFQVDVITCAAPYLANGRTKTGQELLAIYKARIRNILEVAMGQDVDVLILGAFGCGAFRNNPYLMAQAFAELLVGEGYAKYFAMVRFAIKGDGGARQNLHAFQKVFHTMH